MQNSELQSVAKRVGGKRLRGVSLEDKQERGENDKGIEQKCTNGDGNKGCVTIT